MSSGSALPTDPRSIPDVTESREARRQRYEAAAVRLGDELERMVKIIQWAREAIENEMFAGLGYKQLGINSQEVKRISDLSAALNTAVNTKIRWDKAAKEMHDNMSPEEEFQAVLTYLKTLPYEALEKIQRTVNDRRQLLRAVTKNDAFSGPEPE